METSFDPRRGWSNEHKTEIRRKLFPVFRFSAISFMKASVLSLCSVSELSGIVVSLGHELKTVSCVWKGKQLGCIEVADEGLVENVAAAITTLIVEHGHEETLWRKIVWTGGRFLDTEKPVVGLAEAIRKINPHAEILSFDSGQDENLYDCVIGGLKAGELACYYDILSNEIAHLLTHQVKLDYNTDFYRQCVTGSYGQGWGFQSPPREEF